jgi:hypothetical protein
MNDKADTAPEAAPCADRHPTDSRRRSPGRRGSDHAAQAVVDLLSRATTLVRIGLDSGGWREIREAFPGLLESRSATAAVPQEQSAGREAELERKLRHLEQAFTLLARRNAALENALSERSRRGRS